MAEIEWKGVTWRAAYGSLSVKELLTILKGFGPMEILEFEKPQCFRGHISLSLSGEGVKEITLYHLEVLGSKREGQGRAALQWLKKTFKGQLFLEDPGVIRVRNMNLESRPFWIKMRREGLVDVMEEDSSFLEPESDEASSRVVAKTPEGASTSSDTAK